MKPTTHRFHLTLLASALAFGVSLGGSAALTDISQTPLASSSGNLVKANISYVLDTSGSMQWSHAPDESQPWTDNVGYKTSQCNSIYYNPHIVYPPARLYDGTAMANSSFTAAPKDGFSSFDGGSTTTVDLSSSYQAYDTTSGNSSSSDTKQAAYYYNYVGSQQGTGLNYQNKNSQFYKECNENESATPYTTLVFSGTNETAVSSITVNGTNIMSGATSTTTSSSTLASMTQAAITASGYSATVSGSTVTINGPSAVAGVLPVVTLSPPTTNANITFSGSSQTVVSGITVNGVQIMSGGTAQTGTSSAQAAAVAAAISLNGFNATVSGSTVTIYGPASASGYTPSVSMQGTQNATITFSGSSSTIVKSVNVGATNILGAPTAVSSSSSTVAASTDAGISGTYSATSSGSRVTVTGPPAAAGLTPVVTVVPGVMTATLTVGGSGSTSVGGITVNGLPIMGAASTISNVTGTVAANIAAQVNQNGFSASASGNVVTISGPGTNASGQTPVVSVTPQSTSTITFTSTSNSTFGPIKVNGVTITSGTTAASSSTTTTASNVAAKITQNGFSATVSGSSVIITGPASAIGFPPVVSRPTGSMTFTTTNFAAAGSMTVTTGGAFSGTAPMSVATTAFVSNGTMGASTNSFPAPGTMTAAIVAFSPFQKVIVSATSGDPVKVGADERQNFANWYSYYRIRMLMMKSGLGRAFVSIGSNYRVGFMTIYATPSNSTTDPGYLAISDFTTTQKQTWYNKVYSQTPGGGTPLKTALSTAARNIAGKVGPDPQQYSCQQNFILLSTDGYWNAGTPNGKQLNGTTDIGNQDNNAPAPQFDGGPLGASNTLADVAYYYYNTDLRPSTGTCNTGVSGADVCQDNVPTVGLDNANWQHITLFTLGLGTNGQLNYADNYLTGGSTDFNNLSIPSANFNWPVPVGDTLTTIDDLWHAAVNGHGQYFSAKNPDLLVSGLSTALKGVSSRLAAGAAAATSNLQPVNGDNFAYVGSYTTVEWTGDLQSHSIDLTNGAISTTPNWSAQALLDGAVTDSTDSRTIFTFLGGAKVDFLPGSFSSTQLSNWFTPVNSPQLSQYAGWTSAQQSAVTPAMVINYLRGQTGNEERSTNTNQYFRKRSHALGDIIDSTPAYMRIPPFQYTENNYATFKASSAVQSRTGMVYVGANDGMLHAFDGTNGNELWAYIPSFVLPNLKSLASDDYVTNHKYYVDGSPIITDVWSGSAWKTILVSGLNAGGKGYFALDVTDPTNPAVLWEFTDTNMGLTFGNPTINKLTDGSWVVSFTSGYNNVGDGIGRLYVVDAITGVAKFTISTGVGSATSPSGLNKIAAWTDNGLVDNTVQRIYGGDLFGNLWRFDVNNQYPPSGRDALALANFQVGTYQQPITTAPQVGLVNSVAMVYVGTGKYLGASDTSDLNQQSLYGIADKLTGTGIGNARTETTCPLVQQSITAINSTTRTTSQLSVNLTTNCGWFLDFNPGNASPGERVSVDFNLQLGVLSLGTNVPDTSVCTVGGSSWVYNFDYATGQFVSTSANAVAGSWGGNSLIVGLNVIQLPSGITINEVTGSDDSHTAYNVPRNTSSTDVGKRVMWRELLN